MIVAYSYPLLSVFLSILYFFAFFIFIYLAITVFIDLFRSHDIGGWAKALWVIFIVVLPMIGILVYLIARGHGMAQRNLERAQQAQRQFDQYVRQTAGAPTSVADQLATLARLHDAGKLSDEDFAKAKDKIVT